MKKRNDEYYFEAAEALSKGHFNGSTRRSSLRCVHCARDVQKFVKLDERAMKDLNHALNNSEEPEVLLNLEDVKMSIRFVENHWQDMRTILQGES
jgi:hypothetical protein